MNNMFKTDFYQLAMCLVYINEGIANRETGFEGFVRNIKKDINPVDDFYIFDGEVEVRKFLEEFKKEINEKTFINRFIKIVFPKITNTEIIEEFKIKVIDFFQNNNHDFEYNVIKNGTMVKPLIPVFQIKGPLWITPIIETYITNVYNGKTGLKTINYLIDKGVSSNLTTKEFNYISGIVNEDEKTLDVFKQNLIETAIEFRKSTNKPIFEAGFRRAPSFKAAMIASEVSILNGWEGSSNVAAYLYGKIKLSKIGGSMSHAFVMSFNTEEEAFIAWDKIFPGTTFLIDTYDVVQSAKLIKKLIEQKKITVPDCVRIDSDPIEFYIKEIKKIIPEIGIFISGDMTSEKLFNYKNYEKSMAGTKYIYSDKILKKINCGFVYKLVEFVDSSNKKQFPKKKSTGKFNYSGLKFMEYNKETNTMFIYKDSETKSFNIEDSIFINRKTEIIFK